LLTTPRAVLVAALTLSAWCALGCRESERKAVGPITLATTTSMQDSGMLDALLPKFQAETEINVRVVAVGSGQAMEIGRRGDADVLITHSPLAERTFIEEGAGVDYQSVLYNEFVLVGPPDDPARVVGAKSAAEAFGDVAEREQTFISRGDDSGTHQKELAIWKLAGIEPEGEWYLEGGVGMAQALRMADEKDAYVLTDRGTFLAIKDELQLKILFQGDPNLRNVYSVIIVNPERHPGVNVEAARKFAHFLRSSTAKKVISEFGVEKFGQPLFHPTE